MSLLQTAKIRQGSMLIYESAVTECTLMSKPHSHKHQIQNFAVKTAKADACIVTI